MSGMARLSISLPPSLVSEFDEVWRYMQYSDRSKAVHDALRHFISDNRLLQDEKGELIGAIVFIFYPEKPGLLRRINEVQHEFESVISSTMHVHIAKDKCLEIIAVKGKAKETKRLAQKLMTRKGVKQLRLTAVAP